MEGTHGIKIENRAKLTVTGVADVDSFDESTITMKTDAGELVIRGSELHIEKLSLDGGDLEVRGVIDSVTYEPLREEGGFFSRLFRG